MSKKCKNLIYTLITLMFILLAVHFLGELVRPGDMDLAVDSAAAFHDMPDGSIDVLCMGSSHMWRGYDPITAYREYGIASYNFGCYYQKINTTLLFLQDAFRTQSPKLVVIDTFYCNRLKSDDTFDGELYSTKKISFSADKLRYLHDCFGNDFEKYLNYFVPLTAFHGNWTSLFAKPNGSDASDIELRDTFGFASSERTTPSHLPADTVAEQLSLGAEAEEILRRIITLCRANGAEPVFITIPYEEAFAYSDAMRAFSELNDCAYLDLFEHIEEIGLDTETDFSDTSHLNSSGAEKIASFLGKYLSEHFTLPDIRTLPDNAWQKRIDSNG